MATYQFSALADNQAVAFNPNTDVLFFDEAFIRADLVRVTTEGANIRVRVDVMNKDVVLLNTTPFQLATSNVSFADQGRLIFGDNSPSQAADNAANVLNGTGGNDLLAGFGGADTMNGGQGDDTYIVSTGDVLSDAGGRDTVESDVSWTLGVDFENLKLTGTAAITANGNNLDNWLVGNDASNSSINGRAGNDVMWGMGGDDTFDMSTGGTSSYGSDQIDGGSGSDTVAFGANARSAVAIQLGGEFGSMSGGGDGGSGSATLSSVENAAGGNFNDTISGGDGANFLRGLGGNDILDGRAGVDRLAGGTGNDSFLFTVAPGAANADTIDDFASGADKLRLDASVMTALGASGNFTAGDARFWASATGTAHDADDRVLYNTATREVFYDADGNGSGARQLLFTLQSGASLGAADIAVDNGGTSGNVINGSAGDDSLTGTFGDDSINGLGGNDTINGNGGSDLLVGGDGNDIVSNGREEFDNTVGDTLIGGNGNDTLDAQGGGGFSASFSADTLDGGLGDDYYLVGFGDSISDAGGFETVEVADSDWTLGAGFENLIIRNDISESGSTGIGNDLDNDMRITYAGGRLEGLGGNDTLHSAFKETDLYGGDGDDLLFGNGQSGTLDGGAGSDTILGGGATITGGAGADHFAPGGFDTITDYAPGVDRLQIDATRFNGAGASGDLTPGDQRFYAAAGAAAAHDATDRLIYDTSSGDLYYDEDGTGSASAFLLAALQGAPNLAASDIYVINGSGSGSAIEGTAGDDTLSGTNGNDTMSGLGGDDYILGQDGSDSLDGGDGNDYLQSGGDSTHGGDTLVGGAGNDTLVGAVPVWDMEMQSIDTLDGGVGNDWFEVDQTGDTVIDAGGIDTVVAHDVDWTLAANLEDLTTLSGEGSSLLRSIGNALDNFIDASQSHNAHVEGLGGNDSIRGGASEDDLFGGDGNDTIDGGRDFADLIDGGAGDDVLGGVGTLLGGAGNDVLNGSIYGDTLDGGAGIDTMRGGSGDDLYRVTTGDLIIESAGGGVDTVESNVSWTLADNFENLTLLAGGVTANGNNANNVLRGNDANNSSINGRAGNDTMFGMGGNDVFDMSTGGTSSYGNDVIDGGAGTDSVEFGTNARSAVNINLTAGSASGGGDGGVGSASLVSVENALGGNFNDTITGSSGANLLRGFGGNDTLNGKAGVDQLNGGAGNDAFVFDAIGTANADVVQDFTTGADKLNLENAVMTAIGATGNFAAGDARFWSSTAGTAHDANDRVIYDSDGGQLWYDADGSGSGAAQLIATLQGHPALAATDLSVI